MNEALRRLAVRLAPLALLVLLGAAILAPTPSVLELASADRTRVSELEAALARVPDDAGLVVVGFDPDLGTYAEIRSTIRILLADLLARGATLAVVSFTPEGRALAVSEMGRLREAGQGPERVIDLGFVPGAEAALAETVRDPIDGADERPAARALAADGLAAAHLGVVIGGIEIGPRSWVEQVHTRLPDLPLVAVVPTVLVPELRPYLASRQLDALLGTLADGAAYRAAVAVDLDEDLTRSVADGGALRPLPLLVGLLAAIGLLAGPVARRLIAVGRGALPPRFPS